MGSFLRDNRIRLVLSAGAAAVAAWLRRRWRATAAPAGRADELQAARGVVAAHEATIADLVARSSTDAAELAALRLQLADRDVLAARVRTLEASLATLRSDDAAHRATIDGLRSELATRPDVPRPREPEPADTGAQVIDLTTRATATPSPTPPPAKPAP